MDARLIHHKKLLYLTSLSKGHPPGIQYTNAKSLHFHVSTVPLNYIQILRCLLRFPLCTIQTMIPNMHVKISQQHKIHGQSWHFLPTKKSAAFLSKVPRSIQKELRGYDLSIGILPRPTREERDRNLYQVGGWYWGFELRFFFDAEVWKQAFFRDTFVARGSVECEWITGDCSKVYAWGINVTYPAGFKTQSSQSNYWLEVDDLLWWDGIGETYQPLNQHQIGGQPSSLSQEFH